MRTASCERLLCGGNCALPVCMPACGTEPLIYTKNTIRYINACEKCYRDDPLLLRVSSVWHKYQRAADTWCSGVVPCSHARGWFIPPGSHSHLRSCHTTAQFSAAFSILTAPGKGSAGLGDHSSLLPLPALSSPCEGEAEPTYKQLCSSTEHFLERESV